jgi:hypothetical protein
VWWIRSIGTNQGEEIEISAVACTTCSFRSIHSAGKVHVLRGSRGKIRAKSNMEVDIPCRCCQLLPSHSLGHRRRHETFRSHKRNVPLEGKVYPVYLSVKVTIHSITNFISYANIPFLNGTEATFCSKVTSQPLPY